MYANLDIRQSYAQNFTTSQTRFWQNLIPFSTKLSRLRTRQISSQFVGQETCTAYIFHLAKYGDIVNIEMAIHTGNDSFVATPAAARRTIFHILSCQAFVGGTYGRSCRKDISQWIEVMQARASGTAGHKCRWHREKLYAGVPVELFWREQCNARK